MQDSGANSRCRRRVISRHAKSPGCRPDPLTPQAPDHPPDYGSGRRCLPRQEPRSDCSPVHRRPTGTHPKGALFTTCRTDSPCSTFDRPSPRCAATPSPRPWFDGAMNGETFLAYARDFLMPTLKRGDPVVRDNLSSHEGAGVRAAIEGTGTTPPYPPPCSPDLNPIERLFANGKAGRRTHRRMPAPPHAPGLHVNLIGNGSISPPRPVVPAASPPREQAQR